MSGIIKLTMETVLTDTYKLNDAQVAAFLTSKHVRWCSDGYNDMSVTPMQHVMEYLKNINPIDELRSWKKQFTPEQWNKMFPGEDSDYVPEFAMFSDEGNKLVQQLVKDTEEFFQARKKVISDAGHEEVNDSAVRECINDWFDTEGSFC